MPRFALTRRGGLGSVERATRMIGGLGLTVVATLLLGHSGGPAGWAWLGAAALGFVFMATGASGYCPLYARLGLGRPRLIDGLRHGKE